MVDYLLIKPHAVPSDPAPPAVFLIRAKQNKNAGARAFHAGHLLHSLYMCMLRGRPFYMQGSLQVAFPVVKKDDPGSGTLSFVIGVKSGSCFSLSSLGSSLLNTSRVVLPWGVWDRLTTRIRTECERGYTRIKTQNSGIVATTFWEPLTMSGVESLFGTLD